jgi:hypothetical protein
MKLPRPLQALGLPAGFVGLVGSLVLLGREPLFGVLGTLGAMALLLASLARLCESSSTEKTLFRRR